ncbi:MAG: O-antigen ligase family protein [Methylobacter sp.]
MNMPGNEIKNITPANEPLGEVTYYDEYQGFHGMNRFMLMLIMAAMIPWLVGGYEIFSFNITGWAWVIPLVISGLICLKYIRHITFPLRLWILWISLLVIYWYFGRNNLNALQSLFQMLSPIVIGCAASTFRSDNWQLENIIHWLTRFAIIAWVLLIIRVPMILTGALPGHGFMAAEMIGLLLMGACYASFYACGSHHHLYYYFSMLAITVVALVRGPMVAMLSCMPLTLAPMGLRKRILMITVLLIFGIVIFNTDRVQQRMFQSGSGEVSGLRLDNPDFKTTARKVMWDILLLGVQEEPFFGNGWNTHREALLRSGFQMYAPHNDWLKLWHDIGAIGIGLYALTMLLQIFFLVRIASSSTGPHQMLAYGAATAFIPYMLIMFTDNVVLYVQFFGNLHFALIGIVYGAVISNESSANA